MLWLIVPVYAVMKPLLDWVFDGGAAEQELVVDNRNRKERRLDAKYERRAK